MSRVALENIPALTFYKDSPTLARRTSPIPQLICLGKVCSLYTPEVVRCEKIGGTATDVDWRCEADLPSSLRFGRVQVTCEGWSGPGDPYVLQGSCALEYHLVQLPTALRDGSLGILDALSYLKTLDFSGIIFIVVWTIMLVIIAYNMVLSCWRSFQSTGQSRPPPPPYPPSGRDDASPPPPYTKNPSPGTTSSRDGEAWRPGFWTGAALGGLGAHFLHNRSQQQQVFAPPTYDWEQDRQPFVSAPRHRPMSGVEDRGEGSSNLGVMRSSTGFGGSAVR